MKLTHLKIGIACLCAAVIFAVMQLGLIYMFKPGLADFTVRRTITGTYLIGGGAGGTVTQTIVNGESLFCFINYLGPNNSCPTHYAGQEVSVKLASYKHVFGTSDVVVEISSKNGGVTVFDPKKLMHLWWFSSIGIAILMTVAGVIVVGLSYRSFLNWSNEHGN